MCRAKHLFTKITPYKGNNSNVLLGDGQTKCRIEGIGTLIINIDNNNIQLMDVLYVSSLDVSLFSIKMHMQFQGCIQHAEGNECILTFPTFTTKAVVANELELYTQSPTHHTLQFDATTAPKCNNQPSIHTTIHHQRYTVGI